MLHAPNTVCGNPLKQNIFTYIKQPRIFQEIRGCFYGVSSLEILLQ